MAKQEVKKSVVKEKGVKCTVCGTLKVPTLYVNATKSANNSYRFNKRLVSVCKCNEKEVYA